MNISQNSNAVDKVPVAYEAWLTIGHILSLFAVIVAVIIVGIIVASGEYRVSSFLPIMLAGLIVVQHIAAICYGVKKGWVNLPPSDDSSAGK